MVDELDEETKEKCNALVVDNEMTQNKLLIFQRKKGNCPIIPTFPQKYFIVCSLYFPLSDSDVCPMCVR